MNIRKHRLFLTNLLAVVVGALNTIAVVGPNLRKNESDPLPWSARRPDESYDAFAVSQEMICLKEIMVVNASEQEKAHGCLWRAKGEFCEFKDVPSGLVPVFLGGGCLGSFRLNKEKKTGEDQYVEISHLVLLPNGDALGKVVGEVVT